MNKVILVSHNPEWKKHFQDEANQLKHILSDAIVEIHHIGSTAIPGILAKPIIDLLPVVSSLQKIDAQRKFLQAAGYQWYGEYGIQGRRYLVRPGKDEDVTHVHIYETGHPEIERHLAFRDALLNDAFLAAGYDQLKLRLQKRFKNERERYQEGKRDFIEQVLQKFNTK